MSQIEKSIDVHAPLREVYDQWTQFEEFPRFMEEVEEVRQLDDRHVHWRAKIAGVEREWDAEIKEQRPDRLIAWCSTSGVRNAGAVSFYRLTDEDTRVVLQMEYEPQTITESAGDFLGIVARHVREDLKRFKQFIEERHAATGGWRGTITDSH